MNDLSLFKFDIVDWHFHLHSSQFSLNTIHVTIRHPLLESNELNKLHNSISTPVRFRSNELNILVVLSLRVDTWEVAQLVMSPKDRFKSFLFFYMFSPKILKADFQDYSMKRTNSLLDILLSSSASNALNEYMIALFLSDRISLIPSLKSFSSIIPSLFCIRCLILYQR